MRTAERLAGAKRIVIKVGSSSITGANEANLDLIVDFVAQQAKAGKEVIVVSSGAIATAAPLIGLTVKSEDLATSQALASIGQARLMGRYERSLARHELIPGQILLTVDNLDEEQPRMNASRALERLLEIGVVPIINENDSVATQEIRFGDNDRLASRVSLLAKADLLILLSDVDSLYSKPPGEEGAERIARTMIFPKSKSRGPLPVTEQAELLRNWPLPGMPQRVGSELSSRQLSWFFPLAKTILTTPGLSPSKRQQVRILR